MVSKVFGKFKASDVIQGILAISSLWAIIYLASTGKEIPEILIAVLMAVVGYYFRTDNHNSRVGVGE